MCGAVHCSDMAILGIHRTVPKPDHNLVRQCVRNPDDYSRLSYRGDPSRSETKSLPSTKKSACTAATATQCVPVCLSTDTIGDGVLDLGGWQSVQVRAPPPKFSRLVIPFLPNNPRWPETTAAVEKIVIETSAEHSAQTRAHGGIDRAGRVGEIFPPNRD